MMQDQTTLKLTRAILASDPTKDPAAMKAARIAIVDFLACTFGGAHDRSTMILKNVMATAGSAPLIGHLEQTDPFTAALINGHASHVLDFDDVHASVRGHPTIVIVPALLSAAVGVSKSAEALIAAYIVGLETMARLGLAMGGKHYETGFHATATLGTIGAAAAIAHFLDFDEQTTSVALGLAATQSAGLRLQFGTEAKPLHAGLAARAGLTAAKLAQAGLQGASDFLESPIGFFKAFAFGQEDISRIVENWGAPWQIVNPGLTLKVFPCCTASHPVAVGALALHHEEGLNADQIASVTITFPQGGDAALVTTRPVTGIDARFSAEYVFAAAIQDGKLTIQHFDETPISAELAALSAKVTRSYDLAAPRLSPDVSTRFVIIEVLLNDGSKRVKRVDGLPNLSDPSEKFSDATGNDPRFADIPQLVQTMKSVSDLQKLTALINQSLN